MSHILIKNGRVIDPETGRDEVTDVLIEDEKIIKIGGIEPEAGTEVIDASDKIVIPGLIDLHVHLRDMGQAAKETIATGTAAALKGGITTVFSMPNTSPKLDNTEVIQQYLNIIKADARINVYIAGAISRSLCGRELAEIDKYPGLGIRFITDDGFDIDEEELLEAAYRKCKELGLILMTHPEIMSMAPNGVINEGNVSLKLGLPGQPNRKEWEAVKRGIFFAENTGVHAHFTHISTKESLELIRRAKEKSDLITCDVTPHHLCLTESEVLRVGSQAKVNPPLRTKDDRAAIIEGIKDGVIDAIVTDHAPHTKKDKTDDLRTSAFGFSGLEILLPAVITELHFNQGMAISDVVRLMTIRPAEIAGLPCGRIQEGAPADITVVDLNAEKTVKTSEFVSKGKNTPFGGKKLKGWPVMTIIGGTIFKC